MPILISRDAYVRGIGWPGVGIDVLVVLVSGLALFAAARRSLELRGDDATPKLVVFTHLADVAVDLVEDHWYGDTYARVEAKNCRVQFIVPVDRMGDRDIVFVPGQEGQLEGMGRLRVA